MHFSFLLAGSPDSSNDDIDARFDKKKNNFNDWKCARTKETYPVHSIG